MSEPVKIVLLGQPVPWARTRSSKEGVRFTPTKQRNNAATLRRAAQDAMFIGGYQAVLRPILDEPVSIDIIAEVAIPASWSNRKRNRAIIGELRPSGRPDLDNILKQIGDALNGVVFRDDASIVEVRARKVYGLQPKLVITVAPMGALDAPSAL